MLKGYYPSILGDDGKIYNPTRKRLIWNNAPYYMMIKEKIEKSSKAVFGWEDDYCINLNTQKIWSKKSFHFLNPYTYEVNDCIFLYIAFESRKNNNSFRGPLCNVVWETEYQEHINDQKDRIMHLDWDYKNNHPRKSFSFSSISLMVGIVPSNFSG